MTIWRGKAQLRDRIESGIGVNRDRFLAADNDFCTTLLAMAGHDLRQPPQVIIGAHDVLCQIPHGAAAGTQLARAEHATRQLAEILDLLVDALRLHEFPAGDYLDAVPLGPILAELASEFAEPARLKHIELRVIPLDAAVVSHPVLLTGMVRNLVRNAIDYTPRGGRVLIACRRRGSQVHLQVRDSGVGIPDEKLGKIFGAFHRLDATRPEGLGLGLFILKHTADFLGHDVQVSSARDRGSCFAVIANAAAPGARVTATAA